MWAEKGLSARPPSMEWEGWRWGARLWARQCVVGSLTFYAGGRGCWTRRSR